MKNGLKICQREIFNKNQLTNKQNVLDRSGHDFRCAIDSNKINNQLGWKASLNFCEKY